MDTPTTPQSASGAAPADAGISPIASDRLVGAEAIGRFIDPSMTPREVRRRLLNGSWPCWKEGAFFVASKAALLAHWREMTAQAMAAPPERGMRNRSDARGYLGSRKQKG